ncbi:MAG TPA: methyl-accepting chemotaxis protein [Rhizomicrobium sp.]|nr:methyl-accepting chemotaxis protein [Rhizomicrobium sp.]
MKLRSLLIVVCVSICAGFAVAVGVSAFALSTLRVGGPVYTGLKGDFDLLADILPPPAYIIEPYLEATLMLRDENPSAHLDRLKALRKDFDARQAYWRNQNLAPDQKADLRQSAETAKVFWAELDRHFLPAIANKNEKSALASFEVLTKAYQSHRKAIDRLVVATNGYLAGDQSAADQTNDTYSYIVWISVAVVVVILIGAMTGLIGWLLSPLLRISSATRELAAGNLDTIIPGLSRRDELGELAKSVGHFKQVSLEQRQHAEAERERAKVERERAEAELTRADADRARAKADAERARAEQEKAKQVTAMVAKIGDGFNALSRGELDTQLNDRFPAEFEHLRSDFNATSAKLNDNFKAQRAAAERTQQTISAIAGAFQSLANGDLTVKLDKAFAAEFEPLRANFNATVSKLHASIQAERQTARNTASAVSDLGKGLNALSSGELDVRLDAAFASEYEKLRGDFNTTTVRLQDTVSKITSGIREIESGSADLTQASDDLSRRTEQQAASLEQTAAALEQITATVKKTAENAKAATQSVASARAAATSGTDVARAAIQAMDEIEQSSRQINDIIGVIDEIAFQTNLLALNAGVEAARAGDAGKGFAVVAGEVRLLAQRSSDAAKQIKSLIKASSEHVGKGVTLVGNSSGALREIEASVEKIDALVTEMSQAAQQQYTGIEEVNTAVSQMDQVTQQNAAMVEESNAAVRNLSLQTVALSELVGYFKLGSIAGASARRLAA